MGNANIYSAVYNSTGAAVGTRTQVNTGVTGNQLAPVSATLADGSSVVVWASSQSGTYDVYSQHYDPAAIRSGAETRINVTLTSKQGTTTVNETTKAALFDMSGNKLVDFQVSNIPGSDGSFSGAAGKAAQILSLSSGNYVLVRETQSAGTGADVYASIYSANGTVVKADFLATSASVGEQSGPAGLVELKSASGDGVYLRIFSNDDTKLGTEIQVNASTLNNQSAPRIAALADGSFLVSWVSNHVMSANYDVYMQRFAADGARFSSTDQLVSAGFATGNQGVYGTPNAERAQQQDLVALAGGGWVVSYVDNSSGSREVLANIYDAGGNLTGASLQLASVFSGTQEYYPSLAALSNGGFVASWASTNAVLGDACGTGVYMRYFDANGDVRSFGTFEPGSNAVTIEPDLLVGGSANADAYNAAQKLADPTFDIADDGLGANGDTSSTLWKAEANILNFQNGDVLGWDAGVATAAGITVTYDGAGHLKMAFGATTTINGIESLMRTVTYPGGATPAAGDRAIEFKLIDKAGAITTQESGITVESPTLSINGTTGNDTLTGGNGNDGLITHGGVDTVHGGNGNDRVYESNTALSGQYFGDSGFATLVLDFSGNQNVNLGSLVGHAHGIERIDLGNTSFKTNSTNLRIDDLSSVAAITDAGVHRLLVQGGAGDSITLASSLQLVKVAASSQDHVNFDIYQATGSDVQLWLQHGMAISQV